MNDDGDGSGGKEMLTNFRVIWDNQESSPVGQIRWIKCTRMTPGFWHGQVDLWYVVLRKEIAALLLVPSSWPRCSAEYKQFHIRQIHSVIMMVEDKSKTLCNYDRTQIK